MNKQMEAIGNFFSSAASTVTEGAKKAAAAVTGEPAAPAAPQTGLSNWNFTILTQSEFLDLALVKNENSYLAEDGTIVMPFDDPYLSSL